MKQLLYSLVTAIVLGVVVPVWADMPVKDYHLFKGTEPFKLYLSGVGKGFEWANAFSVQRGGEKFYCQPEKLAMAAEQYVNILDREITEHPYTGQPEAAVEMLLLIGLQRTFPCKGGKP